MDFPGLLSELGDVSATLEYLLPREPQAGHFLSDALSFAPQSPQWTSNA
jgi:hypothetical protein